MDEEMGICPVCGTEFKKVRKSHIYCSKKCTNYAWKNGYNKKRKQLEKDPIIHIRNSKKICDYCGKEYFGKRNSKYCSQTCRRLMQIKKEIEKSKNEKLQDHKNRFKKVKKDDQPCFYCKKFCVGCSWSENFKPVKGWKAIPTVKKYTSHTGSKNGKKKQVNRYYNSYKILYCPEYEQG